MLVPPVLPERLVQLETPAPQVQLEQLEHKDLQGLPEVPV